jgi:hypothetical protein
MHREALSTRSSVQYVRKLNTSSNAAPIICRPTERPIGSLSTNPHGKTKAGSPARLTFTYNRETTDKVASNETIDKANINKYQI